jgi:putative hydrolase of the HAD superfamily
MNDIKAVLFDFGGTLFDYAVLENAERESIMGLMDYAGIEAEPHVVYKTYRNALSKVFLEYLPRPFYLHKDLFRDAVCEMMINLGANPDPGFFDWYRERQWLLHKRDFKLRDGVVKTLKTLNEKNIHLGIVSNIDEDQLEYLLELSNIENHFASILSSEKTQSCKPDLGIFRQAISDAGCKSKEALFVGDTPLQDIAGANQMGMNSVLILTGNNGNSLDEESRPDHVIREIGELLNLL